MKTTDNPILLTLGILARAVLVAFGGDKLFSPEETETVLGAGAIVVALAWSGFQKWNTNRKAKLAIQEALQTEAVYGEI